MGEVPNEFDAPVAFNAPLRRTGHEAIDTQPGIGREGQKQVLDTECTEAAIEEK